MVQDYVFRIQGLGAVTHSEVLLLDGQIDLAPPRARRTRLDRRHHVTTLLVVHSSLESALPQLTREVGFISACDPSCNHCLQPLSPFGHRARRGHSGCYGYIVWSHSI